jgi:hypothetical protein
MFNEIQNINNVYQLLINVGQGPMQSIAMISDEEVMKLDGFSEEPEDRIKMKYFRHLNQNEKGLGFHEVLPYANEHEYKVAKEQIILYTKASSTMADIFTNYIHGTTGFSYEKNIPFYNSDVQYSIKN